MTEAVDEWSSEDVRQLFTVDRAHALWVIAVLRLIVKHREKALGAIALLASTLWRLRQKISGVDEWSDILSI